MRPSTLAMLTFTRDTLVSTTKLLKMSLAFTNSKTLLFLDFKFWRKLSFCMRPTKKTIMTLWLRKLISTQGSINLTWRASLTQTKRFSVELEWKNWMMQLKTIILVILFVDLRIAEMMIWEDGLPHKRLGSFIIDLLLSNQSMSCKFWERNVTWTTNNSMNKTTSGESFRSKLRLALTDSKERDQPRRNILRFHLKMLFLLFKTDKYSCTEDSHLFISLIWTWRYR